MKTSIINTLAAVLANLPGYYMSRKQFAARRAYDQKTQKGSFLDNVGEMLLLDADNAFIIQASDLKYFRPNQLDNLGSRLMKLVATKDDVLCTATGPIDEMWLRTFSKITPFKDGDTSEHFVKGFSPGYEGPIMGYHVVRIGDQLNFKEFTQIYGRQITGLDLVSYEGKATLAATTLANFQHPKSTVFTRVAPIQALKEMDSVGSDWKLATWVGDRNVTGLRGIVQNGKVQYTFLDTNTGHFLVASTTDHDAKIVKRDVKGILDTVSGVQMNQGHMATVITDKQIVAIGKDEKIVAELSSPAYADLARMIREGSTFRGIYGKQNVYASRVGDSMGKLMVSPTHNEARA